MPSILIVDDEPNQRDILRKILSGEGYETSVAPSGEEAVRMAESYRPDVVLTDLRMEGMDGIELTSRVKALRQSPEVVIMTAFGTFGSVVEAMKKGAFDYLEKPLNVDKVLVTVKNAVEKKRLLREKQELQQALYSKFTIEGIIGSSAVMKGVLDLARKVSNSPATVLILGESGTGKELIARAIHYNSPRSARPFTAINCAAIPESLIESELFGYEPGAFTGALHRKVGLFEASQGGTLFLDEVGDLPQLTQSKILRVLQEKEVRRLGGREPVKADVRIIAATNKDLEKEMRSGRFRQDLYYRLRVVTIELPPLRERRSDIPELVRHFIERYNSDFGKRIEGLDDAAMKALTEYHWPGNVRQLESVIERAVLMCEVPLIEMKDIRSELRTPHERSTLGIEIPDEGIIFEDLEKDLLRKAMVKTNFVAAKAARLLGMSYKTFWYRWEKFGLNDSFPKEEDIP